ncbi:MAG: hypothetical protein ACI8TQ_003659 [Planctomycetota bacterium]|jgi:hypothetical protein
MSDYRLSEFGMGLLRQFLLMTCLVVGGASTTHASPAEQRMLGLKNGDVLWVQVENHDENGLDLLRVDNGGHVRLTWDMLDPRFERELREQFGYTDSVNEEVQVRAQRLTTLEGQEIIGVIESRSETELFIKTAGKTIILPMLRVKGPAVSVMAPALDLYTREELYAMEATERRDALAQAGMPGAMAHFEFAQYCERIYDFQSSVKHYQLASAADSSWRPKDLANATVRAGRKAEAQGQIDALHGIRRERQRGNYSDAFALVAAFRNQFADSPLQNELNKLNQSIIDAREDELKDRVLRRWHAWATRLTREAGREMGFDEAVSWVETSMTEQILIRVQAELLELDPEIDLSRVRSLFDASKKTRTHYASYGLGTWLLGPDRARAGMKEEANADQPSERDSARKELEDRIKRFLERQKTVARASSGQSGRDPAEFWKLLTSANRGLWLLAYHAEFSGDVELLDVHFRACRECGGTGVKQVTNFGPVVSGQKGPRTRIVSCQTCQHVGIVRRVSYR